MFKNVNDKKINADIC